MPHGILQLTATGRGRGSIPVVAEPPPRSRTHARVSTLIPTTLLLAQALPPVWTIALAAFLLLGKPLACAWSVLAALATWRAARST